MKTTINQTINKADLLNLPFLAFEINKAQYKKYHKNV